MATKVNILGQEVPLQKEPKKIEFIKFIGFDHKLSKASSFPKNYNNVELICKNYRNTEFDLMFAYDNIRNDGLLYIGHFKDGVV